MPPKTAVSWDQMLKLLRSNHYIQRISNTCGTDAEVYVYGPGITLLQDNIRKMWCDRMVMRTESSFPINGHSCTEPLEYYPEIFGMLNRRVPFSIVHISSRQAKFAGCSECLKPLWNFGQETCLLFLHFCPQSSLSTTHDQVVNARLTWWKQFSNNSVDFHLVHMETDGNALSGKCIQYEFPWGVETIETIRTMDEEHLKRLETNSNSNCKYTHGNKGLYPSHIQCEMTLEMATAVFLRDAYVEKPTEKKEIRQILQLNPALAPFKVALCRNGTRYQEINEFTTFIAGNLRKGGHQIVDTHDTQNTLESQLSRYDEMGIPFTVIVSDSTIDTGTIKVCNRDTGIKQTLAVNDLPLHLTKHITYQPPS